MCVVNDWVAKEASSITFSLVCYYWKDGELGIKIVITVYFTSYWQTMEIQVCYNLFKYCNLITTDKCNAQLQLELF